MYRRRVTFAFLTSVFALGACVATGASPVGGGGTAGSNDAGMADGTSSYGNPDDSGALRTHPDSGGVTPIGDASGPPPPLDSGATGTGVDCSGTTSDQLGIKYSTACDNWYLNGGNSNPCTPGGGECSTDPSGSGFTMCCYTPSHSSYCYSDFGGTSQCLPQ